MPTENEEVLKRKGLGREIIRVKFKGAVSVVNLRQSLAEANLY